jgi:hypothetical protein
MTRRASGRYETAHGDGGWWGVNDNERRRWTVLYRGRGARRKARRKCRELVRA